MDAIKLLRDLIHVDTSNPPGREEPAAQLARSHLDAAGLETDIAVSPGGRANLIARLPGPADVPALVLVSHLDVVPVEEAGWSRPPFDAVESDGFLWGRGTLDMKGILAMHVAALTRLARSHTAGRREVILAAFADEEAGGGEGARWMCRDRPARLGFADGRRPPEALGEGAYGLSGILARPLMPIAVGEKRAVKLRLRARGTPGHGMLPPARQAARELARQAIRLAGYGPPRIHAVMREQFRAMAEADAGNTPLFRALASPLGRGAAMATARRLRSESPTLAALLSDTAALTILRAGYKNNVVPGEAEAVLDCRLLPDTDAVAYVGSIRRSAAKRDVSVEADDEGPGPVSERRGLFDILVGVSGEFAERPVVVPTLTPGITDLRYLRRLGARAFGWAPLILDQDILATIHGHDERIPLQALGRAVEAMAQAVERACA